MWCHLVYMLAVVTEGWAPEAIWCEMITWVMSFDYIWFQATHLLHSCSRHRRMNSGGHRSSARNENLLPLKAAIGGDDDEYKSSGMTWGCEQLPVHEGGCLLKFSLILLRYDLWLYFLSLYFGFRYIWPLTRKPCWSAWISCPGLTVTPNTDMGTSHSTGATSTSGRI